ncbi:TPA: NAD-dependent isocitrate dehydrogenase, partial [bacterium]|nr:NAD-dependent isocitrate dehydrogenase [bacterium]
GLYSGIEHFVDKDRTCAESIRVITRKASERIIRFAFEYARREGRKRITLVHKANILKTTCGLFLEVGRIIASSYKEIEFEDRIVDNMAMQLVKKPEEYDVIVCTNLFGDILSDLAAGLVGGLGLAPGANIGEDMAVFEPVHGSAPKYAGKDKVNPTATILSAAMMLKYLGEKEAAEKIVKAVEEVIEEGTHSTYDFGGKAGTKEMTAAIISKIKRGQ